ncbi:MAG: HlyD family efflux transporter periplasmic adaptor subunit [Clostridia bacterium]|nr:HlyD family efflux transporter periplasmic adaptor subunit [Clostridia bacterium]
MKKLISFLLCMLFVCPALAEERFDGQVIAGEAVSVIAPFGGTIESINLRTGALTSVNDVVARLATTRVLASEDGTIRGIFSGEGDAASGTVLYLAPLGKYTISASIAKAYESASTKYVTIGEKVYIRCSKDGSHRAEGVISAVKGSSYTVYTTAGELYMEETVNIYRSSDYSSRACIGSGSVSRTDALAVSGKGVILRMHVKDGDMVERGQLLFETVDGQTDGMVFTDSCIRSTAAGVVAEMKVKAGQQVSKDDVLMTVYQPDDYQIQISVPEDMLFTLQPGSPCSIYFSWNEGEGKPYEGVIREISYMSNAPAGSSGETTYNAYVDFQADETVRLGMNVTVVLP